MITRAMVLLLALYGCGATSGGVEHPDPAKPNKAEYCSGGAPEEQNCMACASKPGCGYCPQPKGGAPVCQPGTSSQPESSGCQVPLLISNEECDAPPPAEASY
jgi:hypothetical protein